MDFNRLNADLQLIRYFAAGVALCDEMQNLLLTRRERRRRRRLASRHPFVDQTIHVVLPVKDHPIIH